jgi:exopolysaccharide biosynthesis polyprenyl glycosylphosphotransferase
MAAVIGEPQPAASVAAATGLGAAPLRLRSARTRVLLVVDALAAVVGALAVQSNLIEAKPILLVAVAACWLGCLGLMRSYEPRLLRPWTEEVHRVVEAGLILTVVAVGTGAWWDLDLYSPNFLVMSGVTVAISLTPRMGVRAWHRWRRVRRTTRRCHVIVTGRRADAERLVREWNRTSDHGLEIVVADLAEVGDAVRHHDAAAVIAVPCSELDPASLRRLGWELEPTGTQLYVAPGLVDVVRARAAVATAGAIPLMHVRAPQLTGGRRLVKEAWERTSALLALLVLSPVLLLVALAIRLDSKGPALFKQTRVGHSGRPFTMLKFRTMHVDAESALPELDALNEADGVLFKMRQDPRVTRLGRLLRRYSIDEVPQLIHVALGQMALVGPRPPLPAETALYEPDVHRRFAVKPGVTGLWQVSGRSDLAWEEAVRLDLLYVDNWSLSLDAQIVARTLRAVLRHAGAY